MGSVVGIIHRTALQGFTTRAFTASVTTRQIALTLVLTGMLTAVGCGPSGPVMVKVKGTVEYKGEVLHNGTITFNPKDPKEGHVASAPIEDDGTFTLSTFKPGDGAVVGDYVVSVVSTIEGSEVLEKDKGLGIGGKSAIPEHYGDPATSGLTESIEAGDPVMDMEFKLADK